MEGNEEITNKKEDLYRSWAGKFGGLRSGEIEFFGADGDVWGKVLNSVNSMM